jgi:hypothetical protein
MLWDGGTQWTRTLAKRALELVPSARRHRVGTWNISALVMPREGIPLIPGNCFIQQKTRIQNLFRCIASCFANFPLLSPLEFARLSFWPSFPKINHFVSDQLVSPNVSH